MTLDDVLKRLEEAPTENLPGQLEMSVGLELAFPADPGEGQVMLTFGL